MNSLKRDTKRSRVVFGLLSKCLLIASFVLPSMHSYAEDGVLTIQGTSIRGNQELPTVLYLVPWQAPSEKALEIPQSSLATSRQLAPIERSEFKRMLKYHDHFLELQRPETPQE